MMMYTVLANKARKKQNKTKEHTLFSNFFRGVSMKDFREGRERARELRLRKDTEKDARRNI